MARGIVKKTTTSNGATYQIANGRALPCYAKRNVDDPAGNWTLCAEDGTPLTRSGGIIRMTSWYTSKVLRQLDTPDKPAGLYKYTTSRTSYTGKLGVRISNPGTYARKLIQRISRGPGRAGTSGGYRWNDTAAATDGRLSQIHYENVRLLAGLCKLTNTTEEQFRDGASGRIPTTTPGGNAIRHTIEIREIVRFRGLSADEKTAISKLLLAVEDGAASCLCCGSTGEHKATCAVTTVTALMNIAPATC